MITNATKNTVVAHQPIVARSFLMRLRGMIGRHFEQFDAMIFERAGAIHMFFMSIPIDVIFLDTENHVCGLCSNLRPWRTAGFRNAETVIELPTGSIKKSQTEHGDKLLISQKKHK